MAKLHRGEVLIKAAFRWSYLITVKEVWCCEPGPKNQDGNRLLFFKTFWKEKCSTAYKCSAIWCLILLFFYIFLSYQMLASSIRGLNACKEFWSFMSNNYLYVCLFTADSCTFYDALGVCWDSHKTQLTEISAWIVVKVWVISLLKNYSDLVCRLTVALSLSMS